MKDTTKQRTIATVLLLAAVACIAFGAARRHAVYPKRSDPSASPAASVPVSGSQSEPPPSIQPPSAAIAPESAARASDLDDPKLLAALDDAALAMPSLPVDFEPPVSGDGATSRSANGEPSVAGGIEIPPELTGTPPAPVEGTPAAAHVSEFELVWYATGGLAERHDGRLYRTFEGDRPEGKQACPT
jgi:hypothetical protein